MHELLGFPDCTVYLLACQIRDCPSPAVFRAAIHRNGTSTLITSQAYEHLTDVCGTSARTPNMTVVVAGSARGIGLELVRRLSADWDVLAIDTYCSPELQVLCDAPRSGRMAVSFAKADVADLQSLQAAAARASTVSALFVVAGVLGCPQPLLAANRDVDPSEDLLRTIRVNTVGPLNVVRAFLDVLEDKATILLMSSTMASLTSAVHDLNPTYSMSKAALNMLGRKLAVELAPRGIDVVMMSPGVVITEMNGYKGDITPQQSVEGMLRALARPGESGRFIRYDGQTWPW